MMKTTAELLSSVFFTMLCLCIALNAFAESGAMVFRDGMAQPVLNYSDLRDEDYTNEGSDILRFCVYVETDYDTDHDGLADLVKVLMQVPRSAAEGRYQAAAIFDPTPYGSGTTRIEDSISRVEAYYENTAFDYNDLYEEGEKREPAGRVSTLEAAAEANPRDWNYTFCGNQGFEFAKNYDYFLVRGFAVAECAGIGTYGSQGFEVCGLDLECDAMACVVEWLAGKRTAFTDPDQRVEIRADWSNGNVAMTGLSYGGTLPYEVATTGVEGLKTIIPYAGIACWYDYTNSQGAACQYNANYADSLAALNCGGTFVDDYGTVLNDDYARFLHQYAKDQAATNGDYGEIWEKSDYSKRYEKIGCSALIVHGLNDFNVPNKETDLMYQAFKKAGQEVKLVFHQDGHNYLDGITLNGQLWQEIVNKWLSHYLCGVDNGIENMAEVTVQSNVDGSFASYDSWRDFNYETVACTSGSDSSTITTEGYTDYVNSSDYNPHGLEESYLDVPDKNGSYYVLEVPENTTIYGVPEIHVKLSTADVDKDNLAVTAFLLDVKTDKSAFKAFKTNAGLDDIVTTDTYDRLEAGGGLSPLRLKRFVQSYTWAKVVTFAETDLCNPGGGYEASDYTSRTQLEAGRFYDYTLYMQPTVYTVQPGHTLYLLVMGWNPYDILPEATGDEKTDPHIYSFTIDNTAIDVKLPVK